jgi:DNA-binding SARP family transcriptional activator
VPGPGSPLRLTERPPRRSSATAPCVELRLLNAFGLNSDGASVSLPMSAQRLVAFVALHNRPLLRPYVAGSLWLDTPDERAAANLRSALWRINRLSRPLIEAAGQQLRLRADVRVDFHDAERLALDEVHNRAEARHEEPDVEPFVGDLLPDWYEDWVLIERERFRQLRLRALEAVCDRLARAGRLGEALDAGLLSVAGEPLRESAHRALVRVHLADGNAGEAIRQYRLCRRLLHDQLGIEPSERMRELVRGLDVRETGR